MEWFRIFLFSTVLYASASAACDLGWTEFQGSCYKLLPYPIELNGSVLESRWGCLQLGADLVTIKTDEEQSFVEDMITVEEDGDPVVHLGVYIAAGDSLTEGLFQWYDGSLVGAGKKWRASNPNNSGPDGIEENCVRVLSGYSVRKESFVDENIGTWVDVPCLLPKAKIDSFFCKRPKLQSGPDLRQHSFRVMKHRYFDGYHIGHYTVTSHIRCLGLCLADRLCLSVNVLPSDVTRTNCILNNATLWEDHTALLENSTTVVDPWDWIYYEIEYPAIR